MINTFYSSRILNYVFVKCVNCEGFLYYVACNLGSSDIDWNEFIVIQCGMMANSGQIDIEDGLKILKVLSYTSVPGHKKILFNVTKSVLLVGNQTYLNIPQHCDQFLYFLCISWK